MTARTRNDNPAGFPWLLCACFTLLALALRVWQLGKEALFFDEYVTWKHCVVPTLGGFFREVWQSETTPPLGFLLNRVAVNLLGDSVFALRLPSALAGAATVWAMMRVLYETRVANWFAYFVMGTFVALSTYDIYYSQQARSYALQVFLIACHLVFAARIWVSGSPVPSRGDLVGFLVTVTLAVAAHLFSIFVLVFSALALMLRPVAGETITASAVAGRLRSSRVAMSVAWLAILGLGVVALTLLPGARTRTSWLPPWEWTVPFHHWRAIVEGPFVALLPPACIVLAAVVWVAAIVSAGPTPAPHRPYRLYLFCGLLLVATVFLPHFVGAFRRILFQGQRYLIISLPAFWLVTALPVAWSRRPRLQAILLLLLLIPAMFYLTDRYRFRHERIWDKAASLCEQRLKPGDMVGYVTSGADGPLLYYMRGTSLQVRPVDRVQDLPMPPRTTRRIAIVSIDPAIAQLPAPPGFSRSSAAHLETHQNGNTITVVFLDRMPASKNQ